MVYWSQRPNVSNVLETSVTIKGEKVLKLIQTRPFSFLSLTPLQLFLSSLHHSAVSLSSPLQSGHLTQQNQEILLDSNSPLFPLLISPLKNHHLSLFSPLSKEP